MKKVDEGVELFDEIYEKVYSAEQQSQKEKYEVELKKEIKKLQRLRDQIKSWISGSEVKDKDSLLEYRRLIETKMEAFKVVEKETKTKTFSKEGLARKEKLDPEEEKKVETIKWVGETIDQLQTLIDDQDLEIEKLSSGKGKKTNKNQIEECNQHLLSHKFHMSKLEGIMRLVRNDRIPADTVNEVKEDLEYYVESHEEDDYMMAYDEECFYEVLGLDDLDVVNVDRVTQASTTSSKIDDATSASSGSKKAKNATKSLAATGMIPLTIGRAVTSKAKREKELMATPTKPSRSNSSVSAGPAPIVGPTPTPKAPVAAPPGGGASMAAVLKRESEERQKAQALQAAAIQAQQQAELARQQQQAAELLRQQQLQKQQAEAQRLQQEAALRQQQAQAVQAQQQKAAVAQAEALKRQQAAQLLEQQQRAQVQQQQQVAAQQQDAAKQKLLLQQAQTQQQQQQAAQAQQQQQQSVLNVGLAGLSLGDAVGPNNAPGAPVLSNSSQQQPGVGPAPTQATASAPSKDATERYLSALNDSYLQIPTSTETDRSRSYTPRNPYPAAPSCYPSSPSPIFDNPAVFEKLGTDALFFIFYYAQGTYQQYLAARELKKQSWRYHKKYMTWFQRHEEPKVTTDDYEQGTYVYFDYETGWCQRIKSDFRFEYSFLEDSLSV